MLKFAVVVCLILAVAVQADPKKEKKRGNSGNRDSGKEGGKWQALQSAFNAEPRACNPWYLIKAGDCANVPVVFTPDLFKKCGRPLKSGRGGRRSAKDTGADNDKGGISSEEDKKAALKRGGGGDEGKGSPRCAAQCVFNSTGHYNIALGTLNITAIKASYADKTANSAVWGPIAASAVDDCYTNVTTTSATYSDPSAATADTCSDLPIRFITCVQRQLLLSAPASELVTTTPSSAPASSKPSVSCDDRKASLQKCDPNFILVLNKGPRAGNAKKGNPRKSRHAIG